MKKILYVVTKSNLGGAQKYVLEASEYMKNEGFDVAVACGGTGLLTEKLAERNIRTFYISGAQRNINFFKELKVFWSLLRIVREFKPDILHLNSPKIGALGGLVGQLLFIKKIIYTNHGWPFNEDRSRFQKGIIKFLSYITILLVDKVVVLSKIELSMVASWKIPNRKNKFVLIPVGVHPFETLNREDAQAILLGNSKSKSIQESNFKVFGTIGELTKNKGYEYILKGLKILSDEGYNFVYLIIGDGEYMKHLEQLSLNLGISERVFFLGNIDQAKRYLSAFDVFILGSVKEGLPYVLVEAGFAQIPVVTTNVGGIPELIVNMQDGIVISPKKPKEICQALIYMMHNQKETAEFSLNLFTKVANEYTFESVTEKLKKLYLA